MPGYRLTLEYDGTRYRGWQEQRNTDRTVVGVLRKAVEETGAEIQSLQGAGRTDAGVHALAQVAHLRTTRFLDPERFMVQVNVSLPHDLNLLAVTHAPARFHARHDALARSYLYQIARRRTAFAKRFVWWVRDPLDADAMSAAARALVGRHDFRWFCERPAEQDSTLVEVAAIQLAVSGDLLLIRVVASHFLWRMVRRLVGTLVEVGAGRLADDDLHALLDPRRSPPTERSPARFTAPPSGLFLERVLYPGEQPLEPLRPATPIR
jgi:tRNA pseudouridine38-40 synthase